MLKRNTTMFWFSICMLYAAIDAAVVVKGDQEDPTFTFPISVHTTQSNDNGVYLFTGADNASGGDFTIAKLNPMALRCMPLAPETITFNQVKDQENPFRDKVIAFLTSIFQEGAGAGGGDFLPLFVTDDDLKTVYLIDMINNKGSVSAVSNASPIFDASGSAETDGIVALTSGSKDSVFAAVRANGQASFGVGNSGITLLGVRGSLPSAGEAKKGPFLVPILTSALNVASSFLKIVSDLAAIENSVDLHWDSKLNRLFVGLQVTGGAAGTDGARAVAVGRIDMQQLNKDTVLITGITFEQIAPDAVFNDATKIVGAVGASTQVTAHKVRTLHVSSTCDNKREVNLSYLIVQGGVGAPSVTRRSVFALPLVCFGATAEIGTLAKKDSTIKDMFFGGAHPQRRIHCFNEAATVPSDVFTDADTPVKVGGGDLAVGDIEDMYILNDTVFVSVGAADAGFKPGIFCSQAIFDETDAIVAWTPWQRFASDTDNTFGFFTDDFTGQASYLTGADASSVDTIKRTQWNRGSENLSGPLLNALNVYAPNQGGIQGFADFPQNTPGLNTEVGLITSTGNGKIIIGQSGNTGSGAFCPTQGAVADDTVHYKDGTIDAMPPAGTRVVSIEGGALDTIGSIVATEVANQNDNGRLFVGGENGLGVLVDDSGDGWGVSGIGVAFEGLAAGMAFKTIGNYSFVYKIISDGDFVYVLTPNKLDRIDVTMSDFAAGTLSVVTVADTSKLLPSGSGGAFCDVVVSEKFAVLATSFGVYRIGNDAHIQTATDTQDARWTSVPVPFGVGPGYALQAISATGRAQGLANGAPGDLYILTADLGNNRSRISRFAIKDVNGSAIDENTMQLLSDVYQKDTPQYFLNPGNLVQHFATDGALVLLGANRNLFISPKVYSTRASGFINLAQSSNIVSLHKNSASGSRLVVTDNGIFTDE